MIERIALAVALSLAPLSAGQAARAYGNWIVHETSDRCALSDITTPFMSDDQLEVSLHKGTPIAEVKIYGMFNELDVGLLTFNIDGHTFKALHPDIDQDQGEAELPVEIFNAMRVGKTLRYEYRGIGRASRVGAEKPFVREISLEGFDEAVASCHAR